MPVGRIQEFNPSTGNWNTYCDRVKMFFTANNTRADKQLSTFLSLVGDETFELITNLTSPRPVSEFTFNDIVQIAGQHLQPKTSVVLERYVFRKTVQLASQNVNEYLCALKQLARKCEFGATLEENLRDQFVCGISRVDIRRKLLEEPNLTYDKAISLATSLEAARNEASTIETNQVKFSNKDCKDDERGSRKWSKKLNTQKFDRKPLSKTRNERKTNSNLKKTSGMMSRKKNCTDSENFMGTVQVNLQGPPTHSPGKKIK